MKNIFNIIATVALLAACGQAGRSLSEVVVEPVEMLSKNRNGQKKYTDN